MVKAGVYLVARSFIFLVPPAGSGLDPPFNAILFIAAIGGFTAYAYALKHLPVATVSLYAYINPVIAVVLGTLILREPFSWRMAVAAVVVLAGMAVVRSRN